MTKDLVCGMMVDEKKSQKKNYKGREYYFCSESCKSSFEKNPERYVK